MEYHLFSTNVCNLSCIYCHEYKRLSLPAFVIDPKRVEVIYRRILAHHRSIKDSNIGFTWTGGDVLTIPLRRLKRFFGLQKRIFPNKYHIRNTIQTNLYNLTDDMLKWLKGQGNNFNIGVSFDFTGATRLTKDGKPSQRRVFRNMQRLRQNGLHFSIICVITNHNIDLMDDIYEFMISNGIDFHFNPLRHCTIKNDPKFDISPKKYARNLVRLIKRYALEKETEINFGDAVAYSQAVLKGASGGVPCTLSPKACGSDFMLINERMDVYPCPELEMDEFRIGNFGNVDLRGLWDKGHPVRKRLRKRLRDLKAGSCRKCIWRSICGKGCASEALRYGSFDEKVKMACEINKIVFRELTKFYKKHGLSTRVNFD